MPESSGRPGPSEKFPEKRAREIIQSVLKEKLSDATYEAENTPACTREISDLVKNRLKGMLASLLIPAHPRAELRVPRYKIMVNTIMVEQREQGARIGSRCFWDETTDFMITESLAAETLNCICTAYAFYFY